MGLRENDPTPDWDVQPCMRARGACYSDCCKGTHHGPELKRYQFEDFIQPRKEREQAKDDADSQAETKG